MALLEPRLQGEVQRHAGIGYEPAQNLDVPVLHLVEQLPDVLQFFTTCLPVVTEQDIDVPKISLDRIPQRLGDCLRQPQMAEPTSASCSMVRCWIRACGPRGSPDRVAGNPGEEGASVAVAPRTCPCAPPLRPCPSSVLVRYGPSTRQRHSDAHPWWRRSLRRLPAPACAAPSAAHTKSSLHRSLRKPEKRLSENLLLLNGNIFLKENIDKRADLGEFFH